MSQSLPPTSTRREGSLVLARKAFVHLPNIQRSFSAMGAIVVSSWPIAPPKRSSFEPIEAITVYHRSVTSHSDAPPASLQSSIHCKVRPPGLIAQIPRNRRTSESAAPESYRPPTTNSVSPMAMENDDTNNARR